MPEFTLNLWRFDSASWRLHPTFPPLIAHNIVEEESWSGHAVRLGGGGPALLVFPATTRSGHLNLTPESGTIRFWFRPDWSSAGAGGQGAGEPVVLLEVGVWSRAGGQGVLSLWIAPDGNGLILSPPGAEEALLAAPVSWQAGSWHQVALGYAPEGTVLYVDGVLAAVGLGVNFAPLESAQDPWGFALGSDVRGGLLAQGLFDEVATFAEPRDPEALAANYLALKDWAALGPVSGEEAIQQEALLWAAFDEASAVPPGAMAQESGMGIDCGNGAALIPTLLRDVQGLEPLVLRLDFCGRASGVTYELVYAPSLTPPIYWQRIAFIPPEQEFHVITDMSIRSGFFKFGKLPDYWVHADAPSGGDGSLDMPYRTIQEALTEAPDGAVIRVLPGVYSGAGNVNLSFGSKGLVLVAERGWEQTTIDCQGANQAFLFASARTNKIIGFTIANALNGAVLCSQNSYPMFMNCAFVGNSGLQGGAISVNQGGVSLLNCRFRNNTASVAGGAIYAQNTSGAVRGVLITQCTFSDNSRPVDSGTVHAAEGAVMDLRNSILWTTGTAMGAEIAVSGGGSVRAEHCNILGGFPGTGNFSADPQFEAGGALRLTSASPCIDQGVVAHHAGEYWVSDYDMDGEARLDHAGFANTFNSTTDIGADEFVYRVQLPTTQETVWVTNVAAGGFLQVQRTISVVDEASGVTFLGSTPTGPLIAVVDDEDRTGFRIFQLNADATAEVDTTPIPTLNTAYPDPGDQEIADMEGLTFDPATSRLYVVTSQTKPNRFRDVDSSPPILDPVNDPPSNDYDRRRAVLVRFQLNPADLTEVLSTTHFESENVPVPYNEDYAPDAGLAAYLRNQLDDNPALQAQSYGDSVLIAVNDAPKFGTPVNGQPYLAATALPYTEGGSGATAGFSLGSFAATGNATISGFESGSINYFKIWAVDANLNYHPGPIAVATNNGIPVILINEFEVAGGNETIELYNPSSVQIDIGGCWISDDPESPLKYPIPVGTTISGRSVLSFNNVSEIPFGFRFDDDGSEDIVLTWSDDDALLDQWNMQNPNGTISEGRAWDGGPRGFVSPAVDFGSCIYRELSPSSPYPPNLGDPNHAGPRKSLDAVADVNQTDVHLTWQGIGDVPPVWQYSPKQHDFHSINIEDIAFRSSSEMILGLRSPLLNRTNGYAYYFRVSDVNAFLAGPWTTQQPVSGITGPLEMDLDGLGIRSIKWCPPLGPLGGMGRYLIVAGTANGGPLIRENPKQRAALYAWDGTSAGNVATPQRLIPNLSPYAVRPEGVDLIQVNGEWRVLFVEDRFQSEGYATRNAIHWPLSILGNVD